MPATRGDPFTLILAFDAVTSNPAFKDTEKLALLQAIQGSLPPQATSPKLVGTMQNVLGRVVQELQDKLPKPTPREKPSVVNPPPETTEVPDPDPDLHTNKPGQGRPRDALRALNKTTKGKAKKDATG
jgi:hypothetical protein